jgi:hypothetical protein
MSADHGPGAGQVNSAVLQAFEPYLEAFADRVADKIEARRGRMINQAESQLGRRKHREAVQRRMANGEGGAGISGRNFLLSPEALREELASGGHARGRGRGKGSAPSPAPAPSNDSSPDMPPKSRARDLGDFEKTLITGLHNVRKQRR